MPTSSRIEPRFNTHESSLTHSLDSLENTLLPSQWADRSLVFEQTPEKRLHFAVLSDAVRIVMGEDGEGKRDFDEAIRWIAGHPALISFSGCCEVFNLPEASMRAKLLEHAERTASNKGWLKLDDATKRRRKKVDSTPTNQIDSNHNQTFDFTEEIFNNEQDL